ncbi:MAG TPA: prephenate dehydrogenase/arogenate dehydrogenase family protein [Clostridiales bacterium]|nr:prephenate dehydrogenase/arogenate dehydrogenase family protein [Clostridiales bacterium]
MQVGLVGLGFMGGSLAKGIKKKCPDHKITAYDKDVSVSMQAFEEKIIDYVAQLPGADELLPEGLSTGTFESCDIVFICTPVHTVIPVIQKLQGHLKQGCILTDIGSTKGEIVEQVDRLHLEYPFIGGHPMTGSEKKGFEYSIDILLENAYYLITPSRNADSFSIQLLTNLLKSIGALVIVIKPDTHDYVTAAISHVPHVIASSLVNTVLKNDLSNKLMHTLAAGGFRDITRIASSSPEIWTDISISNKEHILQLLHAFECELASFREHLKANEDELIHKFFTQAKQYRDSFEFRTTGVIQPVFEFSVSVEDRPGMIAHIATLLAKEDISIKNIGIVNNREGFEGALRIEFYSLESMNHAYQVLKKRNYTVHPKENK